MMNSAIVRIVDFCARHRGSVIACGALLMIATTAYDAARFSINTDIESLISQKLPWHERQLQLTQAFPQKAVSVVVKAPTSENAELAPIQWARGWQKIPRWFPRVGQPESGDFFERNGLLFASPAEVKQSAGGLAAAKPLLSELAADPSLRGIMKALSFAAQGVEAGKTKLDQLAWPLSHSRQTLGVV